MAYPKYLHSVGLTKTMIYVVLFAVLNILPIVHNASLAYMIPLYAAIMCLFEITDTQYKCRNKCFVILGGICIVGLIAIYVHCLIPRRNVISLGTITTFEPTIPKVMFIISGVFALISIWKKLKKAFVNLKS